MDFIANHPIERHVGIPTESPDRLGKICALFLSREGGRLTATPVLRQVDVAALATPAAPDLFALFDEMLAAEEAPAEPIAIAFGMSRTLRHWIAVQSMRNRNCVLVKTIGGHARETYNGAAFVTIDPEVTGDPFGEWIADVRKDLG